MLRAGVLDLRHYPFSLGAGGFSFPVKFVADKSNYYDGGFLLVFPAPIERSRPFVADDIKDMLGAASLERRKPLIAIACDAAVHALPCHGAANTSRTSGW